MMSDSASSIVPSMDVRTPFFVDHPSLHCCLTDMNRKHQFWKEKLERTRTVTIDLIPEPSRTPEIEKQACPEVQHDCPFDSDARNVSDDDGIAIAECLSPADDPRVMAGKFLLMLKERHRMSQTAITYAVESVRKIISCTFDNLKASAIGVNIDSEDIDPFRGLETEYFQTKFYKDHFGLVVS